MEDYKERFKKAPAFFCMLSYIYAFKMKKILSAEFDVHFETNEWSNFSVSHTEDLIVLLSSRV